MGTLKSFHAEIGSGWAVLFSHPADYTPVCTTELGTVASLHDEFARRGVKLFALSIDDAASHKGWVADIEAAEWSRGKTMGFPIIADVKGKIAKAYEMFDPAETDSKGNKLTARAVFFIKDKKLRAQLLYPASSGRNFGEVLRLLDSLQLTDSHKVATPVNWTPGAKCMVLPTIPDAQARDMFPSVDYVDVPSGKKYLRMVDDPKSGAKPGAASALDELKKHLVPALAGLAGVALGAFARRK